MNMKKTGFREILCKRAAMFMMACTLAVGSAAVTLPAVTAEAASAASKVNKKADSIIKKQVKKTDTNKVKLKKLFKYAAKTWGYGRALNFNVNKKGWQRTYALEILNKNSGSCYHFAAGYGYLAKRATGYKVRIGVGLSRLYASTPSPHAWTEVKIGSKWYVCDVNGDKFAAAPKGKYSGKYFLKLRSKVKKTYNNYKGVKYINL